MKIGEHIGKRAIYNNREGYFFETINDEGYFFETINYDGSNLFVFDEKIGHNPPSYFEKHPDEWKDELKRRCWHVSKCEVTLPKKVII